jgi:glycerol-3-phosphate acyltransferase PlsY
MGALLLWRHGGNIRKLLDGTESRIGQKSAVPPAPVSAGDSAVAPATSSTARDGRSTR